MTDIIIKPLTPELSSDYFDFFNNRAFSDNAEWSCCYCTYFHLDEESEREIDDEIMANGYSDALRCTLQNKAEKLIKDGILKGYLAYMDGVPIGWCNANDKSAYIRHTNNMATDAPFRAKVVACFVIAPEYRRQGIAAKLLEKAVSDAESEGYDAVEGFPKYAETSDALNYTGPEALYLNAGFLETINIEDHRIVMRKAFI